MNKQKQKKTEEITGEENRLTWKYFWQQKLYELGIFPTIGAGIYFIPYWIGLLVLHLIKTNLEYTRGNIWACGMLTLLPFGIFIYANYSLARYRARKKLDKLNSWIDGTSIWEIFGF